MPKRLAPHYNVLHRVVASEQMENGSHIAIATTMRIKKETTDFVHCCERLIALAKQADALTAEEADIASFYAKELAYELLPHCSVAQISTPTAALPSEDEGPPFAQAA